MTSQEIFEGLKEILSTIKPQLDLNSITMDSSITADLGIDSLSMLLLSLAIESKFDVQFGEMVSFDKVGDVVSFIEKQ